MARIVPARGWVLIRVSPKEPRPDPGPNVWLVRDFDADRADLLAGIVDGRQVKEPGKEAHFVPQPATVFVAPDSGYPVDGGLRLVPREAVVGWLAEE